MNFLKQYYKLACGLEKHDIQGPNVIRFTKFFCLEILYLYDHVCMAYCHVSLRLLFEYKKSKNQTSDQEFLLP